MSNFNEHVAISNAKYAYNILYDYSIAIGQTQKKWDNLSDDEVKEQIVIFNRVDSGEFMYPEQLHAHWRSKMKADGFEHNAIKDKKNLKHPSMVDYSNLPPIEKGKNALYISAIQNLKWRNKAVVSLMMENQ